MVEPMPNLPPSESVIDQRLDANVLATLDDHQRRAVNDALQQTKWTTRHPVNIRLSVPFFGNRYYLTVVGGVEKRSLDRQLEERGSHPLRTVFNLIFALACVGGATFIMLVLLALYSSLVEF